MSITMSKLAFIDQFLTEENDDKEAIVIGYTSYPVDYHFKSKIKELMSRVKDSRFC